MPSPKHIPQRTCVGCREVKGKAELIRIVRTPQGEVKVDAGGKRPGRGVYLCPYYECWQEGLKGNRLSYTLRGRISPDDLSRLQQLTPSLSRRG